MGNCTQCIKQCLRQFARRRCIGGINTANGCSIPPRNYCHSGQVGSPCRGAN
jgi:hypothetical protein